MTLAWLVAGASLLAGCGASQISELDELQVNEPHEQPNPVPTDDTAHKQVDAFHCTQWTSTETGDDWFIICGLSPAECETLKESERPGGSGSFGACLPRSEAVCVRVNMDGQESEKCAVHSAVCWALESMHKYRGYTLAVRCRRISALELEGMRRHGTIPGAEP